jgi:hypothetical protein
MKGGKNNMKKDIKFMDMKQVNFLLPPTSFINEEYYKNLNKQRKEQEMEYKKRMCK